MGGVQFIIPNRHENPHDDSDDALKAATRIVGVARRRESGKRQNHGQQKRGGDTSKAAIKHNPSLLTGMSVY